MRICLISDELGGGSAGPSAALAELLANRARGDAAGSPPTVGAGRGGAVDGLRERAAPPLGGGPGGDRCRLRRRGPDYLEARDRDAPALMALMARRGGHRSLRDTRVGVRLIGTTELTALQDAEASEEGIEAIADLEREQLRLADRLVFPGGDSAALYRRYYGTELPPAARIGVPLALPERRRRSGEIPIPARRSASSIWAASAAAREPVTSPRPACALPREDWELTLAGPDSETTTFRAVDAGLDRGDVQRRPPGQVRGRPPIYRGARPARRPGPLRRLAGPGAGGDGGRAAGPRDSGRRPDRDRRGRGDRLARRGRRAGAAAGRDRAAARGSIPRPGGRAGPASRATGR